MPKKIATALKKSVQMSATPAPTVLHAIKHDAFKGVGGSYIFDPKTGLRSKALSND